MNPVEVIQLKKRGQNLSRHQLREFLHAYLQGKVEEYQFAAFLMSVWFRGMSDEETLAFTELMRDSGDVIRFDDQSKVYVDKHSTGGVGDKTSLILAPLVAAAGVPVPMMAGRGLAHTGGTLDKLEAIPGFRVHLSLEEFKSNIEKHGFCIMGQTERICPADRRIYALRDVTATVDSLPLICASIMSKKLAEGINALVLDVKCGSGAFMKTQTDARQLATRLIQIGKSAGLEARALITSMDQPLGAFVGNALEVRECIEIMEGKSHPAADGSDLYQDTRELTLHLAAHMIVLGKAQPDFSSALKTAKEMLSSGRALEQFYEMCRFQGPSSPEKMAMAKGVKALKLSSSGYIQALNTEKIGMAAVELGAGRLKTSDVVDPSVGFEFLVKPGSQVIAGQEWVKIHYSDSQKLESASKTLESALTLADAPIPTDALILETL